MTHDTISRERRARPRLRKVCAGLYEHVDTGRLIVRTGEWEGRRGGLMEMWEYAFRDSYGNLCIDGMDRFRTLRAAAEAIGS